MPFLPRSLLAMISFIFASMIIGCGKAETDRGELEAAVTRESSEGHQRMLQWLARVKERVPYDNVFLGDAELHTLRGRLATLPAQAVPQRIQLLQTIGTREFQLGMTAEGIESLESARELALPVADRLPPVALNGIEFTLGVAWLRLGEIQNCVEGHTVDSCLLPIRGKGVHDRKQGSTRAIEYFARVLERQPDHLPTRWLLNIAYMTIGGYPDEVPKEFLIPPESFESEATIARFYDRAPDLGLDTLSLAGGTIVDDFDNDGLLDIMASNWHPGGQLRYFHNDGDGSFSDRTQSAGLTGICGGLNLVQADYDNDGHLDVLVLRGGWLAEAGRQHPNSLLRNNGRGEFRDVTFDTGLGDDHYPTQTGSWADYDNDGDLDLYVGNEKYPNQLFQNQGNGTFVDVAPAAGVNDRGYAKGVVWGDYDNDRLPDLYVSNMDGDNRLFQNLGDGTFQEVAGKLGVTKPTASFPLWFWDYNNDGHLDLFVASFWQDVAHVAADFLGKPPVSELDCLYQGDGHGGFREVGAERNLVQVSQPMGCNFGDLDNDGYLDFYLGTGYPEYEALVPNLMFRNDGGKRFQDVTSAGGFVHLQKGHGVAFADLDNDGDQDIFLEVGGWYAGDVYGDALFENPGFGNHWISVELVGTKSNRSAIGARIRVEIDDGATRRSIYRWVNSGGSFGGNPLRQQIGIGAAESVAQLEVFWPTTGQTQVFQDLAADQFVRITEGEPRLRKLSLTSVKFSDSSASAHHHHHHGDAKQDH